MAVTAKVYTKFYQSAFNGELTLVSGITTLKAMLCTSGYTPNQNTHRYKSDITNEVSGTGYTAGGATLGSVTVTSSGNTVTIDSADTSWPSSTLTGRYLVIYDSAKGSDATRPVISYVDFGADVSTTSGTFQSIWDSLGIFSVTTA